MASDTSSSHVDSAFTDTVLVDTVPINLAELRTLLDEGGTAAL